MMVDGEDMGEEEEFLTAKDNGSTLDVRSSKFDVRRLHLIEENVQLPTFNFEGHVGY